jgi:hypothetical protein
MKAPPLNDLVLNDIRTFVAVAQAGTLNTQRIVVLVDFDIELSS